MRELEKPVARVFRRLRFQRFLATLVWSWAIALAVVAGDDRRPRSCSIVTIPGPDWAPFAVGRAGGHGDRGRRSRWPPARAGWTPRWRSTGCST